MNTNLNKYVSITVFLAIVVGSVFIFVHRHQLQGFSTYGYIGVVIACFLANATVFLPAPSTVVVISMASIYNPLVVAVLGGLGATLGELTGYGLGYYGRSFIDETVNRKFVSVLDRHGAKAVLIFAFLPLPLFDVIGTFSGISRMNLWKFLLACVVGKTVKLK